MQNYIDYKYLPNKIKKIFKKIYFYFILFYTIKKLGVFN